MTDNEAIFRLVIFITFLAVLSSIFGGFTVVIPFANVGECYELTKENDTRSIYKILAVSQYKYKTAVWLDENWYASNSNSPLESDKENIKFYTKVQCPDKTRQVEEVYE